MVFIIERCEMKVNGRAVEWTFPSGGFVYVRANDDTRAVGFGGGAGGGAMWDVRCPEGQQNMNN